MASLGERLVECHQPCLPLSVAVLVGLHLAVVPQFGVQLHQLLFQCITFALDEFQRLCRRQLFLQLHLLLLQIPQQLAQLGQAALLVLLRQGGDAQLQARQASMLTIGISQSLESAWPSSWKSSAPKVSTGLASTLFSAAS